MDGLLTDRAPGSVAPAAPAPTAGVAPTPPPRHCDVIMKGGIASGVVYPAAGTELARLYTLKNIGGASAGAIAAGLFAAAEHRRQTQRTAAGFDELARYAGTFGTTKPGGTSFLLSLFQPGKGTRRLFRIMVAALAKPALRKAWRIGCACAIGYPVPILLGLAPGIVFLRLASGTGGSERIASLVLALVTLLLGLLIPAAVIVLDAIRSLPRQQFGLCPGKAKPGGPPALTDWIEQSLDHAAFGGDPGAVKRPDGYLPDDPLTFADLWGAQTTEDRDRLVQDKSGRRVNLEVMTTNLTQGRPYRLPFESQKLFFHPAELEKLFSSRIVEFMRRHRRASSEPGDPHLDKAASRGLVAFPNPADVPVAVAVRLSLSFPLLVSAVPLWGFDSSFGRGAEAELTECWFSDGGIGSNFPSHFFDGPMPRWPTFALNLTPFHPLHPYDPEDQTKNVWLPDTNGSGDMEAWSSPKKATSLSRLGWFLGAIIDTMHNWRDNIQIKVPGYRDRVAQIHLRGEEGGLNLGMPQTLVDELSARGAYAAKVLGERFSNVPPAGTKLTWDNHCWVRLRSTTSLLEQQLAAIRRATQGREGPGSYAGLEQHPPSYPFEDAAVALEMLSELYALGDSWSGHSGALVEAAPKPPPELRIMPRV